MRVYHSTNLKIQTLFAGSWVTSDLEISQAFGKLKPGNKHYCHVFEVSIRDYPRTRLSNGRVIIDITLPMVGEVYIAHVPDGEIWKNFKTAVDLDPADIFEY